MYQYFKSHTTRCVINVFYLATSFGPECGTSSGHYTRTLKYTNRQYPYTVLDGPRIESRWGARFSAPVQTGPGAHPASCTMGTGPFLGVKSGRGVTLTPHSLLVPWSRKSRAKPLLPLWAVRPAQNLSACTRVHFTFTLMITCCDIVWSDFANA